MQTRTAEAKAPREQQWDGTLTGVTVMKVTTPLKRNVSWQCVASVSTFVSDSLELHYICREKSKRRTQEEGDNYTGERNRKARFGNKIEETRDEREGEEEKKEEME